MCEISNSFQSWYFPDKPYSAYNLITCLVSCIMGKPAVCIWFIAQLISGTAFVFVAKIHIISTNPLLPKSEISWLYYIATFCGCTARFVSDLVVKP